jgi:hypothetical protein
MARLTGQAWQERRRKMEMIMLMYELISMTPPAIVEGWRLFRAARQAARKMGYTVRCTLSVPLGFKGDLDPDRRAINVSALLPPLLQAETIFHELTHSLQLQLSSQREWEEMEAEAVIVAFRCLASLSPPWLRWVLRKAELATLSFITPSNIDMEGVRRVESILLGQTQEEE